MHRDVFGSKGDFITSPEISQMFGEVSISFLSFGKAPFKTGKNFYEEFSIILSQTIF